MTMADSVLEETSPINVVCRFYLMNNCLKGDSCRFAHRNDTSFMHGCHVTSTLNDFIDSNQSQDGRSQGQRADNRSGCAVYASSPDGNSPCSDMDVMVELSTSGSGKLGSSSSVLMSPEDWVQACEFVPGRKWTSRAVPSDGPASALDLADDASLPTTEAGAGLTFVCPTSPDAYVGQDLCPDLVNDGACESLVEVCELCSQVDLSTLTAEERQKHVTECIEQHEVEMERSFAIQRSQEKMCGICMDVVWEKTVVGEQRFGILSDCSHVFCLQCIRKWRAAKQFENKIVRACPECRVKSDFVTPSRYWVEDKEDKKKLIEEYKLALSKKPCKYFDKGRGECPFNEKCFYLHALPDGRIASPKPPSTYTRRRRPQTTSQTNLTPSHMILYELLDSFNVEEMVFLNLGELYFPFLSDDSDEDDFDDFDD